MANLTNYYVDPAINGNSGTGTIGDPWGDLQYALNTMTRDATNGDQINIKAGTAEVLAASLTLATYGTPAEGIPLILRGYTATANDGGMGEIDCGGFTMWTVTTYTDVGMIDLKMHNFGNNVGIRLSARTFLHHCEVHKGASTPSSKQLVYGIPRITGCYIHDAGTTGVGAYNPTVATDNYFKDCLTGITAGQSGNMANNLIVDATVAGFTTVGDDVMFKNNSIYSSTAATGAGILIAANNAGAVILNNIIEGYSGTGGKGISGLSDIAIIGYNAFYNNATDESPGDVLVDLGNDVTCAASPFTNAGGGDFSVTTEVKAEGWPGAWYGPASTTSYVDIGAAQRQEPAGSGGGGPVIGSRIIRGLGAV